VPIWAMLGAMILRTQLPRFDKDEQRLLQWGLVLSVVFAFLHVVVLTNVLGGGDMLWYHRAGSELAELWQSNPSQWTGELLKLAFRQSASFPFWVHGAGSSTGSMFGLSAWLMLLNGKSIYAACVLLGVFNYFSRFLIYHVVRPLVVPEHRRYVLMGVMLLPSVIFWTGGLIKESVAMSGVGIAVLGAYYLAERSDFLRGIVLIALGGLTAYLVKPYVLFPFFIAAPVWYLAARMRESGDNLSILLTPFRMILFAGLVALGLMVLSYLVPSLSVDSLGDELASVQYSGTTVSGNTNYHLISAESVATRGRVAQLLAAPFAFLFALTRPWFFEARSSQTLVATIETTALTLIMIQSVRRMGLMQWIRHILARPWLVFCITYVVIFGTAVGLGSTNVGSLSRYRIPMMPFYGALVAVSYAWAYRPIAASDALIDIDADEGNFDFSRPSIGRRRPLRIRRASTEVSLNLHQNAPLASHTEHRDLRLTHPWFFAANRVISPDDPRSTRRKPLKLRRNNDSILQEKRTR